MFEQRVRFRPSKTAYTYLGPVFIFTLLLAVGIELIARSSLVQRFIPFQAYGSNHVQYEMQLQNLDAYLAQGGQPECFILGNSQSLRGIDPVQFDIVQKAYFKLLGWDENGVPTVQTLKDLDILWAERYRQDQMAPR